MEQSSIEVVQERLRSVPEVPPLPDARYAECVECYEAKSDQRTRMHAWLEARLVSALPADRARVLSVGSGSGAFDAPLLDAVSRRADEVDYVGIDPNPHQCAAFAERLEGSRGRSGVRVDVHTGDFETATLDGGPFDLVHFTHCLYYFPRPGRAVERALELLAPGGAVLAFLAPNEELNALADACWALTQGGRRSWFADDLARFLGDRPTHRVTRTRIDAWLDASACLGEPHPDGARLLDFIAQADTGRLPADVTEAMRRYLRSVAVRDDGGRFLLPHPVDAFLIRPAG